MHRTEPKDIWIGIVIMLASGVVNWVVSMYLIKKGKELRSVGIEIDGEHLRADVVTSFGIAAALIVMQLSGLWWIDPAGAIFVGIWVIGIFFRLSDKLMHHAIDGGLNDEEMVNENMQTVRRVPRDRKAHHKIRTRHSGSTIFIDMHIKMDKELTVEASHNITKEIESRLHEMYKDIKERSYHCGAVYGDKVIS